MPVKPAYLMPGLIIALSFGAACIYAWHGDWRRATYWLAASVLNISVTM